MMLQPSLTLVLLTTRENTERRRCVLKYGKCTKPGLCTICTFGSPSIAILNRNRLNSHRIVLKFLKVSLQILHHFSKINIYLCSESKADIVSFSGRYIYNYPSERALNRGGWFHFCIIAKDSDLYDVSDATRKYGMENRTLTVD